MNRLLVVLVAALLTVGPPAYAAAQAADTNAVETQIGKQFYQTLEAKGTILHSSPWYQVLEPITAQIKRVADRQYYRPFTFILVHEAQPNAFAVPGGNVYVTDSLMKLAENREELAGVLCHETSHDIHHDVINNIAKSERAQRNVGIAALIANLATGGKATGIINPIANIDLMATINGYSREVETAADIKGSETCAEAGSNPYGMIWLFERFEKASSGGQMEMLSDHPTDDHRIADLLAHFRAEPARFSRFSSAISTATPLKKPGNV